MFCLDLDFNFDTSHIVRFEPQNKRRINSNNSRMHSLKIRCIPPRRRISFNSYSTKTPDAATIVQGPALLTQTGVPRPSPTLFFLPGLRSLPFWTAPPKSHNRVAIAYGDPVLTAIAQHLEANYEIIREEYMRGVVGIGKNNETAGKPLESDYDIKASGGEHAATSLHVGTWDWHSFLSGGVTQPRFETIFPQTAAILRLLRTPQYGCSLFDTLDKSHDSSTNPFAYCFFSTLQGKSHIKPHSGPMNLRLRIHLPLIVPKNVTPNACGIRVGDQIRSWEEGKVLMFDDSYEHEVWNETEQVRVLLLIDLWHPDVTRSERNKIGEMYKHARKQGWMR